MWTITAVVLTVHRCVLVQHHKTSAILWSHQGKQLEACVTCMCQWLPDAPAEQVSWQSRWYGVVLGGGGWGTRLKNCQLQVMPFGQDGMEMGRGGCQQQQHKPRFYPPFPAQDPLESPYASKIVFLFRALETHHSFKDPIRTREPTEKEVKNKKSIEVSKIQPFTWSNRRLSLK